MSMIRQLRARLSRLVVRFSAATLGSPADRSYDVVVRAHGDWIALLATVLEREGVVSAGELARLLAEFAAVTAVEKPAEGCILSAWALSVQNTQEEIGAVPQLH
jgi:hypothetical protein